MHTLFIFLARFDKGAVRCARSGSALARGIPTSAEVSCTGKKTPGGAGTHTGHTGHTGARAGTRITRTNLTTIHPNPTTHTRTKTATDTTYRYARRTYMGSDRGVSRQ